jgi:hypothetical protein
MISFSENMSDHEMYFIDLLVATLSSASDLPGKKRLRDLMVKVATIESLSIQR